MQSILKSLKDSKRYVCSINKKFRAYFFSTKITRETHESISNEFEEISRSGVSQVCFRMRSIVKKNLQFKRDVNYITDILSQK